MLKRTNLSDDSCSVSPNKETGLIAFLRRNQQRLGIIFTVVVFILALTTFAHLVEDIDRQSLSHALSNVSWLTIGIAILAAMTSYSMILGYEWSASRYANAKLSLPTLALGGLSAAAIGNALGFSMLTGGSVRYRTYSKKNISAIAIIQMTVFASLSLGVALPPIAAIMAFTDIDYSAKALHINETLLIIIAGAIIAGYTIFLAIASRFISKEHPSIDSRYLCLGPLNLRVPNLRLTLLQFVITFLDVLAAGTVLYCLLPASVSIPFGTFLTVYLLALAAGVLSHVPGGLGVFEVVLLAAFKEQLDQPGLLAALLLYRLIYVVMPLVIACLVLLVIEARNFASHQTNKLSTNAAPQIALLVLISGIYLVFSGIVPERVSYLRELSNIFPNIMINSAHLIASLIGFFCLIAAQGLWRRLASAWRITLALTIAGTVFSLLKGLDWQIALLLSFTTVNLITFRKIFYRQSKLMDATYSKPTIIVLGCTLAVSIWLYCFTYRYTPYSNELWWQFGLYNDVSKGLWALLANTIIFALVIISWLLYTSPPKILTPTDAQLTLAKHIIAASNQPYGALVFGKDKDVLFHPLQDSFIMYAGHDRSLVALSDPVGNPKTTTELIWQFRDYCDLHNVNPVFYQIKPDDLSDYMDIGLVIVKLGKEAILNLKQFDIETKPEFKEIQQIGNDNNLTLKIYNAGELPFEKMKTIIDSSSHKEQQRGFLVGKLTPEYLQHFRIAAIDFKGEIIAFMNLLETNTQEISTIDLIQIQNNAPKFTMEYLLLSVIGTLQQEGLKYFSLGLTPDTELKPNKNGPMAYRLGSLIFRRSHLLYNINGLNRFKDKFDFEWQIRYMAIPARLDPFVALTDVASLISGGLTTAIER